MICIDEEKRMDGMEESYFIRYLPYMYVQYCSKLADGNVKFRQMTQSRKERKRERDRTYE